MATGNSRRPDRLIPVPKTENECVVEYSVDGARTWDAATVYLGSTVDETRSISPGRWNDACCRGQVRPPDRTGDAAVARTWLWNWAFDVDVPAGAVRLRARRVDDGVSLWTVNADLTGIDGITMIDHRNFETAAGGFQDGWSLHDAGIASTRRPSLTRKLARRKRFLPGSARHYSYEVTETEPAPIQIAPEVSGPHRVYVGMEPHSAFSMSFGDPAVTPAYEVPNPYLDSGDTDRYCREFFIGEVDLTGRKIRISAGGSRFWRDVSVRYIKLVRMTPEEVTHHAEVLDAVERQGRLFAGYLEPCTVAGYSPSFVRLREHVRNEMLLNADRGSTDVYVHMIRIGSKAWYHSSVVEWNMADGNHAAWMRQGDPAAVAVEEARKAGLRIFLDAGMNATYVGADGHYSANSARFSLDHPELLCRDRPMLLNYRLEPVKRYVVDIIAELLSAYGADGVNLDFARWGFPMGYDVDSLVDVLARVDACRKQLERAQKRRILISVRVPYESAGAEHRGLNGTGTPGPFAAAVGQWAAAGHVDRFMVELQHERLFEHLPLDHYRRALDGTETEFWADMYWGSWFYDGGPERDLRIARELVGQGVDGGFFYYMRGRPIEWERINRQMRLIDSPEIVVDPHWCADSHADSGT